MMELGFLPCWDGLLISLWLLLFLSDDMPFLSNHMLCAVFLCVSCFTFVKFKLSHTSSVPKHEELVSQFALTALGLQYIPPPGNLSLWLLLQHAYHLLDDQRFLLLFLLFHLHALICFIRNPIISSFPNKFWDLLPTPPIQLSTTTATIIYRWPFVACHRRNKRATRSS